MSTNITMLESAQGEAGAILVKGTSYTVDDELAARLVSANKARWTSGAAPVNSALVNVQAETDPLTGGIQTIAKLTQAQYDAIAVKDNSTLYVIVA